ncbi:MAG TPA: M14 family zinc carboxypeptidase [Candidatus Eisenbacteria bacterium]|nr:M14 family zinc carboxypeptidase [Candidatus Eisenbacteria bacterium]
MRTRLVPPAPEPVSFRLLGAPLAAVVAAVVVWLALSPPAARAATRSLYRIPPAKTETLVRFLRHGIDVAGTGRDGSLHFFLDASERATAEGLGLAPEPLASRGGHAAPGAVAAPPGLGDYHTYAETVAEMTAYAASHASIARLDTVGVSYEGRLLLGVKISDNVGSDEPEPEVLVVGCHHARELMSVELPLYFMRRLLDGYGVDPLLTTLVDSREIWIVPIVNPDGHVYVANNSGGQSDNWWRKNRRPNGDGSVGVDLNRNYGYKWGWDDLGSSPTPASDVYRGAAAFSEPETRALRDFMAAREIRVSASFHSYGQLFLYPWGYAELDTPDHAVFSALGDSVALQNGYLAGNPKNDAIYLTNGDMDDWVYGDSSTKPKVYGFTFELNTYEQGGFYPNDALIPATCALNDGPLITLLRYADEPRRVVPPPRDLPPNFAAQPTGVLLFWAATVADPANPPVRHDLRRIDSVLRLRDDAEAGVSDWDSIGFSWSTTRAAGGTHSYWSGTGNNRESRLTARASVDVGANDSLVVEAWWDLEPFYDYWYAQASSDGGETWTSLQGDRTSEDNPFGYNQGAGISGSSGGAFLRSAFSLAPFAGAQVLVRFRCATDNVNFGQGLYLDNLDPTGRYAGVTITDTGHASPEFVVDPKPSTPVQFQVRAVDPEGQAGRWSDRASFEPDITGVASGDVVRGRDRLWPNAPNPFNPRTRFRFRLAAGAPGAFRLSLFDVSGRLVATIASGRDGGAGGERSIEWNARDAAGRELASGVYLLRLQTVRGFQERKITLLR